MKSATLDAAWNRLYRHADRLEQLHLRDLFADDPNRFDRFCVALDDLTIDLSTEKLDANALDALIDLAQAANVQKLRDAMFAGQIVNSTENRAVLHTALRGSASIPEHKQTDQSRQKFLGFAELIRQSDFTDVVNIGIGGSDLGPSMAVAALAPFCDGPKLHFVSNVDGAHIGDTLDTLNPATTLIIVVSKTFTTPETMTNANTARNWLGKHATTNMAAVSANQNKCRTFGIPEQKIFGFAEWVGGRYSLWSAVGLALAIAIGKNNFDDLLAGAAALDRHFCNAPLSQNLPVLLGLTGIWRRNALKLPSVALIPYDQRLSLLAPYIQQLDMESNGKHVQQDGNPVACPTGPVIWGTTGTNAQHSFFQLLHQGTDIIPVDFILAARPTNADPNHHDLLIANCLAQRAALAFGSIKTDSPHRSFPGNRPSTVILHRQLNPYALGRLIALYEHKVFVMGAIWGINSFDQFGVELGKKLTTELTPVVRGQTTNTKLDPATAGLITRIQQH